MPGPAFAEGDTVSLHPIEDDDHEFVQYGQNHPDLRRPLGSTTIRSVDDVAEMVEDDKYRFVVCVDDVAASGESERADADDRERVGVVGLPWVFDDQQSGFLMYWVAPDHQGNGYVTEATELLLDYLFGECGFHKISAFVLESNDASAAVLEKLGFVREGTLRGESFSGGEWVDNYRYGLLADEWLDG
ncbi:GNAT family N-acetyltransferase [Halobacterium litoreum]|uniref:GNAT family N-acetyltransferase n=1 Tax=Halobacterium litoreum TaxID=2039234 RepID=A0ABD5NER8_9EURY|nr:GNAT family protein [Halobacterium litoreum]UHH13418.1 GNAT family N-acetyltransferase [Halobacterium litoreum]